MSLARVRQRVAAAKRELDAALDELECASGGGERSETKARKRAPLRLPPAPATPPSAMDRARVRRALGDAGFVKVTP